MNLILPYLVLLILITDINSYNILVFCPLFGHSHSTYFGKLADILTEAGHSVTLFTPAIIDEFRNHSYTKLTKDVIHLDPSPKLKSIGDLIAGNGRYWKQEFSILEIPQSARFFQSVTGELHNVLSSNLPLLDKLKKKKFDLFIFESIFTCALPLIDYLEIPAFTVAQSITFESSSMRAMGEPVMPSYIPGCNRIQIPMILLKFLNTAIQVLQHYFNYSPEYYLSYDNPNKRIHSMERLSDASFVFTNSNPYLDFPRAIVSKNVQIGGISVDTENLKIGKISGEWDQVLNLRPKSFLIAFGSVILSKDMSFEYKVSLARAMKQFSDVTFIWKYEDNDTDSFAKGIKNIHFSKWIPQRELLADPRLSAFMTHGGLGSVNEVSYLGKPNVMCPIMGDQMRNAKMLARHNGSVEISKHSLGNSKIVEEAFRKVIYDQSYTIAAKRLAEHLQNQPVKPKYSFLKHAEFAARFGKLPSLDPYSRQMGFSEYFLLDLLFISICLIFLLCLSLYFLAKVALRFFRSKPKTE
ncbi:Protein CBG27165 [Caenorhabditis briggsae]|uniref:glucuronosyltransferase n=1 Tax=Caenorhabditis briggsae TaxID=6238 RepID=B6IL74_CAEBR|nr:Protein CBG27165 [Caenorhabditis briggsae]CAS00627.1 Protein CBG27165 [Caenorhabditis briggsae]